MSSDRDDITSHFDVSNITTQLSMQEIPCKDMMEPWLNSFNTYSTSLEEQRLQIEEVREKVLLDDADPRITNSEPNRAIPFTILNIFPYGIVEVTHADFGTFKVNNNRLKPYFDKINSRKEDFDSVIHRDHENIR
ncbi:hypothetical protein GOBAR_AA17675 [Gossypium barbadense]|uniref:Uncharacterized protein n=1 Tax=Gossypium barbadense TaxID=3634 RepID=A0A2P5XI29_GOSBA|nr:hypothetical protein GOBAR_AA17675 [Gossypium barbadense]